MQELNNELYAFGDGAVVRCATNDNTEHEIVWRPDNTVLCTTPNVTAKHYPLMYITDHYILLFSATVSLSECPLIIYDRVAGTITNRITEFTIAAGSLTAITGLQRIVHNGYAIINMTNATTQLYAVCLMDINDPTKVIPLLTDTTTEIRCTYAGYVLLDDEHILFMLSLHGKTTEYTTAEVSDSNLYRLIYNRRTDTIVSDTMAPVLHHLEFSGKWLTICGAIFHQIDDSTLLVLTSMYGTSSAFFVSGVVSSSDFSGTEIDSESDSWLIDTRYEAVGRNDPDDPSITNVHTIGMKDTTKYARRRVLYALTYASGLYTANSINNYSTYPFATTSIDDDNVYFMIVSGISAYATLIHVKIDQETKALTYMTYAKNDTDSYAYIKETFPRDDRHVLAYDQETDRIYETYHTKYNGGPGIYATRFAVHTESDIKDGNGVITDEYGDYRYMDIKAFSDISPQGISNVNYIPFNGKLYAGYSQIDVTDKLFVPIVQVE